MKQAARRRWPGATLRNTSSLRGKVIEPPLEPWITIVHSIQIACPNTHFAASRVPPTIAAEIRPNCRAPERRGILRDRRHSTDKTGITGIVPTIDRNGAQNLSVAQGQVVLPGRHRHSKKKSRRSPGSSRSLHCFCLDAAPSTRSAATKRTLGRLHRRRADIAPGERRRSRGEVRATNSRNSQRNSSISSQAAGFVPTEFQRATVLPGGAAPIALASTKACTARPERTSSTIRTKLIRHAAAGRTDNYNSSCWACSRTRPATWRIACTSRSELPSNLSTWIAHRLAVAGAQRAPAITRSKISQLWGDGFFELEASGGRARRWS